MKILLADFGLPFTMDTPYNSPLGGSETSLLLLAKGLAQLNHNVVILTTSPTSKQQYSNNLIQDNISNLFGYAEIADIIILNRQVVPDLFNLKKPVYYYAHDAWDQPNLAALVNSYKDFEKILCVSKWQKESFNRYFGIPNDKIEVIGNSIDYSLYMGATKRDEFRLIFASIPYKGLNVLPDLFNDISKELKDDRLNMKIFSSMNLYANPDGNKEYGEVFLTLSKMKNVEVSEVISMKALAFELMKSSIYLAPNLYHESFGMVLAQAQAAGCYPVTTAKGAVYEIIDCGTTGMIMNGPNIEESLTYKRFILETLAILTNKNEDLDRKRAQEWAKQWDYINIAKKLSKLIS